MNTNKFHTPKHYKITNNWVHSAQDKDYWRALVNPALNLQVP